MISSGPFQPQPFCVSVTVPLRLYFPLLSYSYERSVISHQPFVRMGFVFCFTALTCASHGRCCMDASMLTVLIHSSIPLSPARKTPFWYFINMFVWVSIWVYCLSVWLTTFLYELLPICKKNILKNKSKMSGNSQNYMNSFRIKVFCKVPK